MKSNFVVVQFNGLNRKSVLNYANRVRLNLCMGASANAHH